MEHLNLVSLLIRYNELGLKSRRVRSRFQNQLIKNIEDKFLREKLDCFIDSDWGRIYLHTEDETRGIKILTTIFGITSLSPVITCSSDLVEITETTVNYTKKLVKKHQTFALRTRRTGKHKYTSMELAEYVGREILDRLKDKKLKVKLDAPDVEIFIEVRRDKSYIFSETFKGPGGLPLGTQGKVVSIFTDEHSFIASWLMMKRGCRIYPVFFKSVGDFNRKCITEDQIRTQIEILKIWVPNLSLKIIDIDEPGENIFKSIDLNNNIFIRYLKKVKAKGICISMGLDGFSLMAQTINTELPIFYPLIGLDEHWISELDERIKTTIIK